MLNVTLPYTSTPFLVYFQEDINTTYIYTLSVGHRQLELHAHWEHLAGDKWSFPG